MLKELVEISPGTWVRPEQVTAVIAFHEYPPDAARKLPPRVQVYLAGQETISWQFDTWDDAKDWAAKIAGKINAPVLEPEAPPPDDWRAR